MLKQALRGARHLEGDNEALRKRVHALEDKLARLQEADDVPLRPKTTKRAAASVASLRAEVHKLKAQVQKLEKVGLFSPSSHRILVSNVRIYPNYSQRRSIGRGCMRYIGRTPLHCNFMFRSSDSYV